MALAVAKGLLEQLQQQEATVRNQLLGDVGLAIERYPRSSRRPWRCSARDHANTVLRAPIAGTATQVASIQMGRFLTAGMAVFSIIGTDNVWVDANPKETDLTYVRPGQLVAITVDTFPSREWRGKVVAISPGTGAQFAILPPQNAAGNWIKIVQRVPSGSSSSGALRRLRSGMSATVEIDTGRRGRLARLLGSSAVAQVTGLNSAERMAAANPLAAPDGHYLRDDASPPQVPTSSPTSRAMTCRRAFRYPR